MPADTRLIVPWRGGCVYRERNWFWLRDQWEFPWVEAAHPAGPWVKASAVMPAVEAHVDADVVIVADSDVWCDQEAVEAAVVAVLGGAPWAMPHSQVRRLSNIGTDELIATGEPGEQDERSYLGIEGGGIIVAKPETLLDVPLDPRFVGWGQEDEAWGLALRTLAGLRWRGVADLLHLWHPPSERWTRRRGSKESWELRKNYSRANGDAGRMRTLIGEIHAHSAAHSAVPDRP